MLKGHLSIELKNEKTGEIKKVEQDNMVTNAIASVLGLAANCSAYNSNEMNHILPLATRGLGGLFMFDGTLEEKEDNIHFPMDVHLTGSGGRVANTASKITGSLNTAESGKTDTGYTSVWDFSTSQANGTIASLALTNYKAGEDPFYNEMIYDSSVYMNRYYSPIGYDAKKGIIYFYSEGKVYKKQMYTNIIDANSPTLGEEILIKDFSFEDPKYSYWDICNGYDGYLYAIYATSHSSKSTVTFRIKRWRIDDFSFEEDSELNFSLDNITNISTSSPNYTMSTRYSVSKGYLYFVSYDYDCVYKVNLSNTVDVKEIKLDGVRVHYILPRYNGGLFAWVSWPGVTSAGASTTYYSIAIIYSDGKFKYKDESTSTGTSENDYYTGIEGDNLYMVRFNKYYTAFAFARNYIGTICNLATPVVKTSAQSMKVTYTLTDIDN